MIEQAIRSGRAIPPKLLEPAPEVGDGLQLYMHAFWALQSCRMDPFIPWTAVQSYCDHLQLPRDEAMDMHYLISGMDQAYIKWRNVKGKTDGKPERTSGQDGPALKVDPRQRR